MHVDGRRNIMPLHATIGFERVMSTTINAIECVVASSGHVCSICAHGRQHTMCDFNNDHECIICCCDHRWFVASCGLVRAIYTDGRKLIMCVEPNRASCGPRRGSEHDVWPSTPCVFECLPAVSAILVAGRRNIMPPHATLGFKLVLCIPFHTAECSVASHEKLCNIFHGHQHTVCDDGHRTRHSHVVVEIKERSSMTKPCMHHLLR